MGFFEKLKAGLTKTKESVFGQVNSLFKRFVRVDEDMLEELEELLIMADVGFASSEEIIEKLRERIRDERISDPEAAKAALCSILEEMIGETEPLKLDTKPSVILVIGVTESARPRRSPKLQTALRQTAKTYCLPRRTPSVRRQ